MEIVKRQCHLIAKQDFVIKQMATDTSGEESSSGCRSLALPSEVGDCIRAETRCQLRQVVMLLAL